MTWRESIEYSLLAIGIVCSYGLIVWIAVTF